MVMIEDGYLQVIASNHKTSRVNVESSHFAFTVSFRVTVCLGLGIGLGIWLEIGLGSGLDELGLSEMGLGEMGQNHVGSTCVGLDLRVAAVQKHDPIYLRLKSTASRPPSTWSHST